MHFLIDFCSPQPQKIDSKNIVSNSMCIHDIFAVKIFCGVGCKEIPNYLQIIFCACSVHIDWINVLQIAAVGGGGDGGEQVPTGSSHSCPAPWRLLWWLKPS